MPFGSGDSSRVPPSIEAFSSFFHKDEPDYIRPTLACQNPIMLVFDIFREFLAGEKTPGRLDDAPNIGETLVLKSPAVGDR